MKDYKTGFYCYWRISILAVIASTLTTGSLDAQYMVPSGKSKLIVGSYLYDYNESQHFFNEIPASLEAYQKSIKKYKTGKDFGYTSLGALGVGTALLFIDQHQGSCEFICLTTGQVIGIFSIFVVFPLTGTIGILTTLAGKGDMRNAAQIYNDYHGFNQPKKDEISLSFGMTQGGLGFVINF